jgi:hypothetical protein
MTIAEAREAALSKDWTIAELAVMLGRRRRSASVFPGARSNVNDGMSIDGACDVLEAALREISAHRDALSPKQSTRDLLIVTNVVRECL